jgi:citrate lyase subunit beta/citryl-CoA lyase
MTRRLWRSMLYAPAHVEKYVRSAPTRGADGIILDLEDSVPLEMKAAARAGLSRAVEICAQGGADIVVRINRPEDLAHDDIEAAVSPGVKALYLPKVESADDLKAIEHTVSAIEARKGMTPGHTRFWILIESALGYQRMDAIATASPRSLAMTLGAEDFAADVGMEPDEETLRGPKQQLIITAAAAGLMPMGVIGGASRFDDPEGYLAMARRSRRFGYVGSSCIHPSHVSLLNQAFSPTADEIAHAERIVAEAVLAEQAGRGAFSVDGRMVDAPIVARAQAVLERQKVIAARGESPFPTP